MALTAISLLLIAMQFTTEINWKVSDFIVTTVLLFGTTLLIKLIFRVIKITNYRMALLVLLFILLLLLWTEFAVGIFGTPFAGS